MLTTVPFLLRRLFIETLRFHQRHLGGLIQIGLLTAQVVQVIDIDLQLLLRGVEIMQAVANFLLLKFFIYFCYVVQYYVSIRMRWLLDLVYVLLLIVVQIVQLLKLLHLLLLDVAA